MFKELLIERIPNLSSEQVERLATHYELLVRWNRVLNLTRILKIDEVVERHYGESVFLARELPPGPLSVVDVGSGAGFPGAVVAAVRQEVSVTLVESHHRKAAFLSESTRDWPNVRVAARRIEDEKERFDWALCRAVRWKDIDVTVARIVDCAAVLAGADPPESSAFVWESRLPVPWGEKRFLYLGRNVPRETPEDV